MGGEKTKIIGYGGVVVFLCAIIYFIISVYVSMQNGSQQAQNEFSTFVQSADIHSFSTSLNSYEESQTYFQKVKSAVATNSYIEAVVLTVDNAPVFAYPISSSAISMSATRSPTLVSSSALLKTFSMSVPDEAGRSIMLQATIYTLRPQDIFNTARISFLVILAYTLVVFVFIIYISFVSKDNTVLTIQPRQDSSYSMSPQSRYIKDNEDTIPIVFKEQDKTWDEFFVEDDNSYDEFSDIDDSPRVNAARGEENDVARSTELAFNSYLKEYEEEVGITDAKSDEAFEITVPSINDPLGLFSDTTGVGWYSYMETRLDSELVRAASSEQDLALLIIRLKGIEDNKRALKKVSSVLLDFFKFRDFVFEYKTDGFACIMLDIDLDQTMILAETLYNHLDQLLVKEDFRFKIGIGLSTRSLRLLPGSRLITEASEAVEKSFDELELPIVAFRVSPDKYRQFVANQ